MGYVGPNHGSSRPPGSGPSTKTGGTFVRQAECDPGCGGPRIESKPNERIPVASAMEEIGIGRPEGGSARGSQAAIGCSPIATRGGGAPQGSSVPRLQRGFMDSAARCHRDSAPYGRSVSSRSCLENIGCDGLDCAETGTPSQGAE